MAGHAFALVFLEWLFFVTKPSFLDETSLGVRFASLWVASFPFVAVSLLVHGCLLILARLAGRLGLPGQRRSAAVAAALVPALLLSATALLLIDNFTYTAFGWGVVSTRGWAVLLPLAGLLFLFALFLRRTLRARPPASPHLPLAAFACWLLATALGWGWLYVSEGGDVSILSEPLGEFPREGLPNILVSGVDGLEAERMSAYGYERKTTPHLDRRLDRAWLIENAFVNAGRTTGSLTSLMTGRLPTTKVLFPPHSLHGAEAYQHLPRLLRGLGYRSIQETVRFYADGGDLNWKESFDEANGRRLRWAPASSAAIAVDVPTRLVGEIRGRLAGRLRHLFGIEQMPNVFDEVVSPDGEATRKFNSDLLRIERVLRFIEKEDDRPFFAHIHLLETHCCTFLPGQRVFSAAENLSDEERREAAYDDTILGTDAAFGRVMDFLEEKKLLRNTVVIFLSDHTRRWGVLQRVPLVFFFPDGRRVGRSTNAAQLLDVAPTLLDALGLPIPPWMEGDSLLGRLPADRPIYAAADVQLARFKGRDGRRRSWMPQPGPPFFGLRTLGMLHCQRWYAFELDTGELRSGEVPGYVEPCPEETLPAAEEAAARMSRHLQEQGYAFRPWRGQVLAEEGR